MKVNIEYLEEFRKKSLMTINEITALAEISPTTYRKMLAGEEVSSRVLKKLIGKLKVDRAKLIPAVEVE